MLDWGSRHLGQSTTAEQWLEETPGLAKVRHGLLVLSRRRQQQKQVGRSMRIGISIVGVRIVIQNNTHNGLR